MAGKMRISCPSCGAILSLPLGITSTKRVQCTRCMTLFRAGSAVGAEGLARGEAAPSVPQIAPAADLAGSESSGTQAYFFGQDGLEVGPVSREQLKAFAAAGRIRPDDLVWRAGSDQKVQASGAQKLLGFALLETPSPRQEVAARPVGEPGVVTPSPVFDDGLGTASQAIARSSSFPRVMITEPLAVIRLTAGQLRSLATFGLQHWRNRATARQAREANIRLGLRLEALRQGDEATLASLAKLRSAALAKADDNSGREEIEEDIDSQLIALAERSLSLGRAIPQTESEFHAALSATSAAGASRNMSLGIRRRFWPRALGDRVPPCLGVCNHNVRNVDRLRGVAGPGQVRARRVDRSNA